MVASSFFLVISSLILLPEACITPSGLNFASNPGSGEIDFFSLNLATSNLAIAAAINDDIQLNSETPISFRRSYYVFLGVINALQAYDPIGLDAFARVNVSKSRKICFTTPPNIIEAYYTVAGTFAAYYNYFNHYTDVSVRQEYRDFFNNTVGINVDICDTAGFDCSDISTPWGLAYTAAEEVLEYSYYDGWNADGSYNRDVNEIPYEDWRENPYIPRNNPWRLRRENNWQPLLETDGLGFLYNQEHVVPHIGFTGKLLYLSPEYYCNNNNDDPEYDYDIEIPLLFNRLSNLNDIKKAKIEIFDNKILSLGTLFLSTIVILYPNFDINYWYAQTSFDTMIYESLVTVWRQKVLFDKVRPTSIVQKLYKDEIIYTYAGATLDGASRGNMNYSGSDFTPYFRTMPHSEYPSGSACQCEAFAEWARTYWGTDDIVELLGTPLTLSLPAFSSKKEPLTTPATDIVLTYYNWTQVSNDCAFSRLDAGLHFTESIYAGAELCRDLGRINAQAILNIRQGIVPDYVNKIDNYQILEDQCDDYKERKNRNEGGKGRDRRGRY